MGENAKRGTMILRTLDFEDAKILAKAEAEKTGQANVVIHSYIGRAKAFRILPEHKYNGKWIIRFAPENKHRTVLHDNGNGEPGTVKAKPKSKRKRRKTE